LDDNSTDLESVLHKFMLQITLERSTYMSAIYRYPFQNPDFSLETRVNDLVSRFTLEEKVNLMCQYQDEIERLSVKPYKHGTEAAHGIAWLGKATTFPQPIGLACTWDTELLKQIGDVIGDEARGYFKKDPAINGLTLWAPTVDMERDPRWGRTEEAYGEDPHLAGKLSSALTQGLQGDHPFYLKAVASLKHFIGNNNEVDRGHCSVSIDPRNMNEYYLKAFEIPFIEGGAQSMMTAYNSVNGVPANLNPDVKRIVKERWGMNGFVVSDAGDVLGTVKDHKYYTEFKHAVAHSIKSGIDSITDDHPISKQALHDALAEGLLSENDMDIALRNTFRVRFRLGEFDPEELNPYASIPESVICKPEHAELSRHSVRKNIVLLKNDNRTLPLSAEQLNKVAVIGPLGNVVYKDWYSGSLPYAVTVYEGISSKLPGKEVTFNDGNHHIKLKSTTNNKYISLSEDEHSSLSAKSETDAHAEVFEVSDWGWGSHTLRSLSNGQYITTNDQLVTGNATGIGGWFTKEVFQIGHRDDGTATIQTWNNQAVKIASDDGKLTVTEQISVEAAEVFREEIMMDGLKQAVKAAKASDVAIVVVGNHPLINGKETMDRPDITLPESQERLIKEVYAANPNTIVVIVGSYPYAINWVDEHVPAILYTSHAGQELGNAIADVLFGDYSPAGRLNMTWYRSVEQLPDMMDYDIIKGKRTYQYFDGDALYPFGHGLTYGAFHYTNMQVSVDTLSEGGLATVSVDLENIGSVDSDEVVQLYVRAGTSRVKRPLKQLIGFKRLCLTVGQKQTVHFPVKADDLRIWDVTRERYCLETGSYTLMIGVSSGDIQLTHSLTVIGETIPPRNLSIVTHATNYDEYDGVVLGECTEGGSSIADIHSGDWISFKEADMHGKMQFFEARVACHEGGSIEIRLDQPDGQLVGTCSFMSTGGPQVWHTHSCSITNAFGVYDVYLVFKGSFNFSTFRFIR
jgi:beta-glucosidase